MVISNMFRPPKASELVMEVLNHEKMDDGISSPALQPARQAQPARIHMAQPIPARGCDIASTDMDSDERMAFILKAPPVRGKFDAAKAKALGVPNGPLRGKLTKGETIELDDPNAPNGRRVIKPEEVIGDGQPGGVSEILRRV
jgi:ribonuclease Z